MRTASISKNEQLAKGHFPRSRLNSVALHCSVPSFSCEAEVQSGGFVAMSSIVIRLDLGPVVFSSAVGEGRRADAQFAALNSFDPGGVAESKTARAFDEAMALIVVTLNERPFVNALWHVAMLRQRCASRVAFVTAGPACRCDAGEQVVLRAVRRNVPLTETRNTREPPRHGQTGREKTVKP